MTGYKDAADLYSDAFIEKAKLLHWTGPHKPWHNDGALYQEVWDDYFIPDPTRKFKMPGDEDDED